MTADEVIELLGLVPHPEGGWWRSTWRDDPADGTRGAVSVIHYLLCAGEVSRWHRVDATEVWTHVAGGDLHLSWTDHGQREDVVLAGDPAAGSRTHAVVPPHAWQAARPQGDWALVTCVVAPAFLDAGFELTDRGPDDVPPT